MKKGDLKYLRNYIKIYYQGGFERIVENVKDPHRREWALLTYDNKMYRHIRLDKDNLTKFKDLVLEETPKGLYYSASYYQNPDEEMELKGRESTDLIFDLDADHMDNIRIKSVYMCVNKECRAFSFKNKCEKCGGETRNIPIIDDVTIFDATQKLKFLISILNTYLGIPDEYIKLYFSGHRGFHIHIEEEPYISLDDIDRIAIKDLLVLDGIDIFNVRDRNAYILDILLKNLESLLTIDDPELKMLLNRIKHILTEYDDPLKALRNMRVSEGSRRKLNEYIKKKIGVEVDPAVLTDLSRLIRAPLSLHGKTGLIKKDLEMDDIDNPMNIIEKSIPSKLMAKIHVEILPRIVWAGKEYGPYYMEDVILPEPLAIYLINLGLAKGIELP